MSSSDATLTLAYILLAIYMVLLFVSLIWMRPTEHFDIHSSSVMTGMMPCWDNTSTTTFHTSEDAYNAGRMFKYHPILNDPGTCFYYTDSTSCVSNVNGLTLTDKKYNHGKSADGMMACVYSLIGKSNATSPPPPPSYDTPSSPPHVVVATTPSSAPASPAALAPTLECSDPILLGDCVGQCGSSGNQSVTYDETAAACPSPSTRSCPMPACMSPVSSRSGPYYFSLKADWPDGGGMNWILRGSSNAISTDDGFATFKFDTGHPFNVDNLSPDDSVTYNVLTQYLSQNGGLVGRMNSIDGSMDVGGGHTLRIGTTGGATINSFLGNMLLMPGVYTYVDDGHDCLKNMTCSNSCPTFPNIHCAQGPPTDAVCLSNVLPTCDWCWQYTEITPASNGGKPCPFNINPMACTKETYDMAMNSDQNNDGGGCPVPCQANWIDCSAYCSKPCGGGTCTQIQAPGEGHYNHNNGGMGNCSSDFTDGHLILNGGGIISGGYPVRQVSCNTHACPG